MQGPQPAAGAVLTDRLPAGLTLVSAPGSTYDPQRRVLSWDLGDIPVTFTGQRQVVLHVDSGIAVGTALVQQADLTAAATLAPPRRGGNRRAVIRAEGIPGTRARALSGRLSQESSVGA